MQTMRAAILESAPGGVHIEEIPMPEPGAGEILVKVSACGVCHTDLHVMKAEVAFPTPAVMGREISGTVAALRTGRHGPSDRSEGFVTCYYRSTVTYCSVSSLGRPTLGGEAS